VLADPCPTELICLDPKQVHLFWPYVAPLLRKAIERTGLSAFADVRLEILGGHALVWLAVSGGVASPAIEAAASTILQQTDAGKICIITACAGSDWTRWLPLIAGIESYARDEGCRAVRIFGRKGWLRILHGYRQTNVILDKKLN
jgi:hypothetical protein